MDDLSESKFQNEENNENSTFSAKENQIDENLGNINHEINGFIEQDEEFKKQNENTKDLEKNFQKINKVVSSDSLVEIKTNLFSDVHYYTINCTDPLVRKFSLIF